MKKILALFVCCLLLCGCGADKESATASVEKINCTEKDKLVSEGAILVDVRTMQEFNEGHLDGSVNISSEIISSTIETMVKDKNTKIIVYCRSGNRSATAANTLVLMGYKHVYDLGAMSNCSN